MEKELKQYILRAELGRGGMATVYRAFDTNLEREVALKVLPAYFSHEPQFAARFEREAKTVSALEHSAIVPIYDYGEVDGVPFLVMRLMNGGSLSDRLDQGPFSIGAAARVLTRIASALDRAHERGIIHRDLKPDNILFDDDGNAFLADFGIVKIAEGSTTYTQAGGTLGTPAYMSPEQAQGQPIGPASDVYALGIIFFQVLTGARPFNADTPMALAMKHITEPVPRLADFRAGAPAGAQAIIDQAMAKSPDARHASAGELAQAVQDLALSGQPAPTRFAAPAAQPVGPGPTVVAAPSGLPAPGAQPAGPDPTVVAAPGARPGSGGRSWRFWAAIGGGLLGLVAVVAVGIALLTGGDDPVSGGAVPTATGATDEAAVVDARPTATENAVAEENPPTPTHAPPSPTAERAAPVAATPTVPPTPTVAPTLDDCARPDVLCVGLVTDVGEIDDKSFNQSAWEGVQRAAAELGALVDYVETQDPRDYGANIALFTEREFDVIVTVGFGLGEATLTAADSYPSVDFIGVDQFQGAPLTNLVGLIFEEDKAGFLAGALAGQLTDSDTIAAVLGTDLVPPVVAFGEGYANGAAYVNASVDVLTTYHPGGLDVAFTDPEWGAAAAAQAMDSGADVIFGAGGKTGNGALIEAAGRDGVFCIGVDTDQWETVPEAHPCLVSSAMKLLAPGVFELIALAHEGRLPAGNYIGNVGLAPFHNFDGAIPVAVLRRLAEIEAGLSDGSIETGYVP